MNGFIYIMGNPALKDGSIKIGITKSGPKVEKAKGHQHDYGYLWPLIQKRNQTKTEEALKEWEAQVFYNKV